MLDRLKIDLISRFYPFSKREVVANISILNFSRNHFMMNEHIEWDIELIDILKDYLDWNALFKLKSLKLDIPFFEKFIDYIGFITKWLEKCLEQTVSNSDLQSGILQYLSIVKEVTNDFELAVALKEETAKDLEVGYAFWVVNKDNNDLKVQEQFKHIKWHTVHEFMTLLRIAITSKFNTEVSQLKEDQITACTHRNSSRAKVVISFEYKNILYYICNDSKGFKVGCIDGSCKKEHISLLDNRYKFNDFSAGETFDLINEDKTKMLISRIVEEINKYIVK